MVHAENGDAIDVLVKQALAEGKTEPRWHAATRPPETEAEATNRAVEARAHRGLPAVRRPRLLSGVGRADRGRAVARLADLGRDVHAVPVHRRDPARGAGLRRSQVRVHAAATPGGQLRASVEGAARPACCRSSRPTTARSAGVTRRRSGRDDFSKIPNGGPGVENRLHMLHHFGVRQGRLTMNQLVDLCCTQPARLFGLFPRKGTIAAGADADIVVWDSEKPLTLSAATHHSNVDYNLFEGTEVIGAPGGGAGARAGDRRRATSWSRRPAPGSSCAALDSASSSSRRSADRRGLSAGRDSTHGRRREEDDRRAARAGAS